MPDPDLVKLASKFFRTALVLADDGRAAGKFKAQTRIENIWQFPDFKYSENGPELGAGSGPPRETDDWSTAAEEILTTAKRTQEYQDLVAALESAKRAPGLRPQAFLESVAREFLFDLLNQPLSSDELTRFYAEQLDRQYRGLPVQLFGNVRLFGVVIPDAPVRVHHRDVMISIRQTDRADVEVPVGIGFQSAPFIFPPDAIAELTLSGRPFADVQILEARLVAILRLYLGVPIFSTGTELFQSPSHLRRGMSTSQRVSITGWRKALLGPKDQDHLQQLWERLADRVPTPFSPSQPGIPDDVLVAYLRLADALDNAGNFESSVTSAVMGLEALYFKPSGEQAELTFRLSIRAARFLGLLGKGSMRVRGLISDAYDVRSGYVHGGRISYKERRALEKEYESLRGFQEELIDLLRRSVVAGLVRTVDKEEFIDAIDDTLIDSSKFDRLKDLAADATKLLTTVQQSST